ncbi:MAG TPA: hypothetical protein VNI54_06005 [Thermoanaerobaculia bacterium]|nr:hypothetical protein [Thermoanaerobaculia bacterium]
MKKASSAKVTTAPSKKAAATIECGKWVAFHDFMPGKTPTLTVTGYCKTPTPGYKIKLVETLPGINPKILMLKKIVTKPTKPQIQVITTVEVRFTKKTKFPYTHVTILPDGKTIKVKKVQ